MRTVIMLSFVALAVFAVAGTAGAMPSVGDVVAVSIVSPTILGEDLATFQGAVVDMTDDFICINCYQMDHDDNVTLVDPPKDTCLALDHVLSIITLWDADT